MLTHFRPLLTVPADGSFRAEGKQFFFEHFFNSMTGRRHDGVAQRRRRRGPQTQRAAGRQPLKRAVYELSCDL